LGKARDLATLINDKVLPILKKQTGFADETLLVSDTEPNCFLAISFWNTKEDAWQRVSVAAAGRDGCGAEILA
jgi:heme-degrading monooxygenase HmoA